MDELFYLGILLLSMGTIGLSLFAAYKIGERKGKREYYDALTSTHEEDLQ